MVAIFLYVVAALALLALPFPDSRWVGAGVFVVAGFLAVVCTVISAYDRVDTRNVGIKTHFGRPIGVCGAGPCWHAPWDQVSELSEAIQLQAFESNSYDDAAKGIGANGNPAAIGVRLANNSMAYVNANLNWRLREGAAPKLFQDYGGRDVFDTIKQQLVDRQEQVALSKTFAKFNPQVLAAAAAVQPGAPAQQTAPAQGADLPGMANEVKADLQGAVGQDIEIIDVRIQGIFYDQQTQQRIDAYNQKVQETMNAAQDVKTAEQQRDAAIQRASQPKPDLTIAIFNCIQEAVAQHRPNDAAGCAGQIGGTPLIQLPKP
jgi:hypothetical protein